MSSTTHSLVQKIDYFLLESKHLVIFLSAVSVLWKRDVEVGTFISGAFLSAAVSKILKRVIKQERPSKLVKKNFGMPSSHALTISYFCSFLLRVVERQNWSPNSKYFVSICLLVYSVGAIYVRVKHEYHNVKQVGVGIFVGTILGLFWYWLCFSLGMNGMLEERVNPILESLKIK